MKGRTYEVDTSAYLIQVRKRGGLTPSPYIMEKYQESERLRRCRRGLVMEAEASSLDSRKALTT